MRIISGTHKGKQLIAPKKLPVRPTTDMAKEALFNILSNRFEFERISVLDFFSGTGNISYELASRGATKVTAVDNHYLCIKYINETSKVLDLDITTIKSDTFKFLERTTSKYDIIFADPPYNLNKDVFLKIPEMVFNQELLKESGLLIIEHSMQMNLETHSNFSEQRKYGSSMFSFFEEQHKHYEN